MAARKTTKVDSITIKVEPEEKKEEEVRVPIKLPLREEDSNGLTVEKYEHVTIGNEGGSEIVRIKRGEPVEVTVPVFTLLRQRYPDI